MLFFQDDAKKWSGQSVSVLKIQLPLKIQRGIHKDS